MTDRRLDLPDSWRYNIKHILREHLPGVEVWAYGSRVSGESHPGSDLDLALRGPGLEPLPADRLLDLAEAFERSNIPILVQAHDWGRLPDTFHREIERQYLPLGCAIETGARLQPVDSGDRVRRQPSREPVPGRSRR